MISTACHSEQGTSEESAQKPQKRGKVIPHGDSEAYGLRMTYQNLPGTVLEDYGMCQEK